MTTETDEQLMRIHVATLFNCDADGRILSLRRPWSRSGAPPRFFMGRTQKGNVWLFRRDVPDDVTGVLERLCQSEASANELMSPPRIAKAIRAALEDHGPITREYRGPAWLIPEGMQAPIDTALITKENSQMLELGFPWLLPHIIGEANIGPVTAALVNRTAVSVCYCARLSPSAAEAGVETSEAMRGRGYGTAAVAAWAVAIRASGLLPLYSTSWENLASQRVAQKLRMVCYGEDWEIE